MIGSDNLPAGTGDRVSAIDLAECVFAWVEAVRPDAARKGLALRCVVDSDLPDCIACDRASLRQIVVNLVENAVRSTDEGWVSVCAEPAWDDPAVLAISVTDTGPGMGEAEARMALGEEPAAVRPGHWGIGLAISAGHAARLGGSLTLRRAGARGLRAELRFPLRALPVGEMRGGPDGLAVDFVDERDLVRPLGGRPLGRTGAVRTERRRWTRSAAGPTSTALPQGQRNA